ncbi:MAG: 16S rRNA (guanine(966)-N(2))-methyltransferase RsmD [Myxococcota bacterium]
MRVVGGALRGRRLGRPPEDVRPTSDRVRESLFAILGDLEGRAVLDLYAGTGSLGIEALSRGAQRAVFVDRSSRSLGVLRQNLRELGLEDRSRAVRSEVLRRLRAWGRDGGPGPFDLVLLDPPYADTGICEVLEALLAGELLSEASEVVVECSKRNPWAAPEGFDQVDERRYGDTVLRRLRPAAPGRGT